MRLIDLVCPTCGTQTIDHFQRNSAEALPFCVDCYSTDSDSSKVRLMRLYLPTNRGTVIGDDIPGGVLIHNGLCNSDGTPRRFYSKTDIKRAAEAKGLVNRVEHIGRSGGDSSKHTTRWV